MLACLALETFCGNPDARSPMSARARSATDFPFRFTIPYSVTTNMMSVRGVVTTLPGVRFSTMRLRRSPRLSYVDDRQMNDFPPFDA